MSLLRNLSGRVAASALLALTATSLAHAQTQAPYTVFNDTFSGGSTVNSTPTTPTPPAPTSPSSASYALITSQAAYATGTTPAGVAPGKLSLAADTTLGASGAFMVASAHAIFSQYPVKLAAHNDYIEIITTFTAETTLLTDSTNASNANGTFVFSGLHNTSTTTGNQAANRDTVLTPDTATPPASYPLSAYVHAPNPAVAGGQTGVNSGNNLGNTYAAYWRGYTSRHYRTSGRNQAFVQLWSAPAGQPSSMSVNNLGNGSALNPTATSTLAPLVAGQQYTTVFRITRENTSSTNATTGVVTASTRLVLKHDLYPGTAAQGTPLSTYTTGAVSSGSQHAGLVYDALSLGMRLNGNTTSGSTQIMTINGVKIVTTGITVIPPQILTQPSSPNPVSWGDAHTYTVVATGGGDTGSSLSYQWKKDGHDIANATSASYTIPVLDYTHAGTYSVVVTNSLGSVTSAGANLVVNPPAPPTVAPNGDPVSLTVTAGNPASFTVVGAGAGLSYKWQKSTDGVNFTDIPGATSATYTIARTQGSSIGQYRGVVINTSGSATSAAATLNLTYSFAGITPSGYAASATGGGSAAAVEVSNAADFKAQAESANDAVITVAGTINLNGKVSVKSNKTIQGKDGEATVIGNLELTSGVGNVIIRGINITNPAGNGVSIVGASNIYISHVSFFDCSDTLLSITGGADNVTVSWSEFYYSTAATTNKAVLVGNTGETKPIQVTFDHNWWSDKTYSHMPETTYGRVHMYNNLFQNLAGTEMLNDTATRVHANAQVFSERNQYSFVKSPITKEAAAIGSVRAVNNVYTSTSGTNYESADFLTFTPPYSYQMSPTTSVTAEVSDRAGNITGASASTPTPSGTASVTSTATTVPLGGSFILTAVPQGFSVDPASPIPPYQWRLNGTPIGGPTTSNTLNIGGATGSNTGNYTVAITVASGQTIVSTPLTITTTSGSSLVPASNSEASGGGGSPSFWFMGALAFLAGLRRFLRK